MYLHYFAALGGDGVDWEAAVLARPHARREFRHDGSAGKGEKREKAKDRARGEKKEE